MPSDLLQYLENNEAILLMYLAGELPEQDRLEVEQMLKRDPGLRATLAELAALQDDVHGAFARADAGLTLSGREAAVRAVSRAVTENAQRRAAAADAAASNRPAHQPFRVPWWTYPIAAAAIVLVAVIMTTPERPPHSIGGTDVPQFVQSNENPAPETNADAVAIIPAANTEDRLGQIEKELLSINSPSNELELFGGLEGDR
jgi:hypothetical protein